MKSFNSPAVPIPLYFFNCFFWCLNVQCCCEHPMNRFFTLWRMLFCNIKYRDGNRCLFLSPSIFCNRKQTVCHSKSESGFPFLMSIFCCRYQRFIHSEQLATLRSSKQMLFLSRFVKNEPILTGANQQINHISFCSFKNI